MARFDVRIEGLREFSLSVRRLEGSLSDVEKDSTTQSATLVAGQARSLMPIGPAAGGHVRNSIIVAGSTIRAGGSRFPYYAWLDFGGRVGRGGAVFRPFLKGGRYLFRSYRFNKPRIENVMENELEDAIRSSGLRRI